LLWQKRDAGLLAHFIEQVTAAEEKERGWQRYREIRRFVEASVCRHRQICSHFGEVPKWTSCQACDVCGFAPEWLAEPAAGGGGTRRSKPAAPVGAAQPRRYAPPRPVVANPGLREHLREWRRSTAKQQGVPAYVVMHDTTLDEICRLRPGSLQALLQVPGIGERKLETYGRQILDALSQFHKI
jgi:ATP-dependent DNA helicase RecQ